MTYNLDKHIQIYVLQSERDEEGFEIIKKKYIHPLDKKIKAYFRDLRSSEIVANKQVQDETEAEFVINRRVVEKDMYIEYNRRTFGLTTYQITSVDGFKDDDHLIKLSVKKVSSLISYDKLEGTEWNAYL